LEKLLQKMDEYICADNGALEEGLGINLGKFIAYSVVRTRAIL
jgi:hypothetical protein